MSARSVLAAVAGALLLAACSQDGGTTIGPPEAAAPTTTASTPAPAATSSSAAAPTSAPDPTPAAPSAPTSYVLANTEIPLHPDAAEIGTATVTGHVPAGWKATTTTADGYGEPHSITTIDRRDPTGQLLVRYRFEPAPLSSPNDTKLNNEALTDLIAQYRKTKGVVVTVLEPPSPSPIGLQTAQWALDLTVDGVRRHVLVESWVTDGEAFSAYVSVPVGLDDVGAVLYERATAISVVPHLRAPSR